MPKIVANRQVAHLWANQSQEEARSHNGNYWFQGPTLYSYRTPIAHLVAGTGGSVALVTNESFSVTTNGKHIGPIWGATRHLSGSFRVPSIGVAGGRLGGRNEIDHGANVAHLMGAYRAYAAKLMRRRDGHSAYERDHLERLARDVLAYCASFALARPRGLDVSADWLAAAAAYAARQTPESIAKREREAAKRAQRKAQQEAEANAKALARFRAGGYVGRLSTPEGGAYLRARGDLLETSLGATVPLADAIKVFRFAKLCRERGEGWSRNGARLPVGGFQVDRIAANGDFHAGCHLVQWAEVEALAEALGLANEAPSDAAVVNRH